MDKGYLWKWPSIYHRDLFQGCTSTTWKKLWNWMKKECPDERHVDWIAGRIYGTMFLTMIKDVVYNDALVWLSQSGNGNGFGVYFSIDDAPTLGRKNCALKKKCKDLDLWTTDGRVQIPCCTWISKKSQFVKSVAIDQDLNDVIVERLNSGKFYTGRNPKQTTDYAEDLAKIFTGLEVDTIKSIIRYGDRALTIALAKGCTVRVRGNDEPSHVYNQGKHTVFIGFPAESERDTDVDEDNRAFYLKAVFSRNCARWVLMRCCSDGYRYFATAKPIEEEPPEIIRGKAHPYDAVWYDSLKYIYRFKDKKKYLNNPEKHQYVVELTTVPEDTELVLHRNEDNEWIDNSNEKFDDKYFRKGARYGYKPNKSASKRAKRQSQRDLSNVQRQRAELAKRMWKLSAGEQCFATELPTCRYEGVRGHSLHSILQSIEQEGASGDFPITSED